MTSSVFPSRRRSLPAGALVLVLGVLVLHSPRPSSARMCVGTNTAMSKVGQTTEDTYNFYKNLYSGCTYVDGNVEITHIDVDAGQSHVSDQKYDFSFLRDIEEIKGYLLIFHVQVGTLPFDNLKIIRGQTLFGVQDSPQLALYVHNTNLRELRWTSLREIQRGKVAFIDNDDLCYEETINWNDILVRGTFERNHTNPSNKRQCLSCNPLCSADSGPTKGERHCWGGGPDMCQTLSKVICNAACPGQRCFGPNGDQCCSDQCAGGCTGQLPTDCAVCADFNNNGTCVSKCPEKMKYNPEKFAREVNPDFRFTYGTTCVEVCPPSYYEDDDTCVRTCSQNKTEMEEGKRKICTPCNNQCPKVCWVGWKFQLNEVNLKELVGCTTVQGSITISQTSLDGDPLSDHKPLNYSALSGLRSIQKIYGYLKVEASAVGFTNLSFFENLEVILGQSQVQMGHSLWIYGTSLKFLGLSKLTKIEMGSVLIYNNQDLCYADQMDWNRIVQNPKFHKNQLTPLVNGENKNVSQCQREGRVCHPECDDAGCWGPSDQQCLSCRHFKLGSRCLRSCEDVPRTYEASNRTCKFCNVECANSCTNEGADHCDACKHVRDGPYCKKECPYSKYTDPLTNECKDCHMNCREMINHPNCDGPLNTIGPRGCYACDRVLMNENETFADCLEIGKRKCPSPEDGAIPGYYPLNQPARKLLDRDNETVVSRDQAVCKRCNDQCLGCESIGPNNCLRCANFRILDQSTGSAQTCIASCPTSSHYADVEENVCRPCHKECRDGCDGPESTDCTKCLNFYDALDYEDISSGDVGNNRSDSRPLKGRYNCTSECPPSRPFLNIETTSDRMCSELDPNSPADNSKRNIGLGTGAGLLVVCIIIFVGCICYRTQRMRKHTTEILRGMTGDIPVETVNPTDAEPNMSKLRLIKEEELRKGGVLGSGAFGTVYKGVWIPALEPSSKVPVAIKVLREGNMASRNLESLDEAFYMASMDHPCLVRLLAVCLTQQMMLITQLMPLGCLLDYVRNNQKNLGSKTLLDFCTQISRGMAYLESRRLVHRDLAARNVLVQTPKQVKITDFGLAKLLDVNEDVYHAQGGRMPIKWLALESILHRTFTHKSDVWSFGVTCWEIFTFGQRPYESVRAREVPELLEKGERLPQPAICSLEVYMITIKCWMIDPDSRPSFADLTEIFSKLARDPGRYLVIPGDKHLRLPSATAYAGAIGGEGSFEDGFEDGTSDPIDSLSMQNPYLTPESDGSSSHPPPPYTLQQQLNNNNNNNNNQTLPSNHPQYRNPPPPMSSSSHSGTPVAVTPMPYTDVRPGGTVAYTANHPPSVAASTTTLPRRSSMTRGSRASSPPVAAAGKNVDSGLVVNLPPNSHVNHHRKSFSSHPSSSLSGGVVLNPAFTTTAAASFASGPRHSSTSPANLGAEVAGAVGGLTPQRTQSKYGNLEQAAATNAMQPRLDSGASRYSSDPTNGNLIASSRSTPIVLNAFGGVDFVLTHPSPSATHPQQQPQQQPQNEEIHSNTNPSSLPSLPPPLPSTLPAGSSGTPYYGELGNLARDGVTVLPLDEDDYLRPQSTINSANNSRDNSAGSVGKDYYSDPKYLNVLTGAVGKLQEVIPSSTNPTPHHLNGRNGPAKNPKKGQKTFTAVPAALQQQQQQQQPSLKYPQGKPPIHPSSTGIDNPEYFAGPNGNPPSSPASTLSFPTSPTDSLTFLLKTPTKEEFSSRNSPATTTCSFPSSHGAFFPTRGFRGSIGAGSGPLPSPGATNGVTMQIPGTIDPNGIKQVHPSVRYHEYYNDYGGASAKSSSSPLSTAVPTTTSSSTSSSVSPPSSSSQQMPNSNGVTPSGGSDKQRLLSSSSSGTDSVSSPGPNSGVAASASGSISGARSDAPTPTSPGGVGIASGGSSRLSMRTRKETML